MAAGPPHQPALSGRMAAALAVASALEDRRFVSEALRQWRLQGEISGREAALAMEIGQGAVRHLFTIEHVLSRVASFDPKRVTPLLRAILYTGAYQVVWLDRIPTFAAVDRAVDLARRLVSGKSPGMVNAILRRLSAAIVQRRVPWRRLDAAQVRVDWEQACLFGLDILPAPEGDHVVHLAAATGEDPGRYAELLALYGPQQAEAIAWASQATPVTVLYRNPLRATPESFERCVRAAFGDAAELVGDSVFLPASVGVLDSPAFKDGLVFVQDSTAHRAALALEARPGERVLDLCAAPGSKSVVLALQMDDQGQVLACDTSAERLARVDQNASRLGLTCIRTQLLGEDPSALPPQAADFDAALVDVPCSNTGVIARRPEARLGLTPQKLCSLRAVQSELLSRAARLVRPGGRLVYSTCSLEPQENEEVVTAFLQQTPDWRLERQETALPAWGPRCRDWRDGGYYARLVCARA